MRNGKIHEVLAEGYNFELLRHKNVGDEKARDASIVVVVYTVDQARSNSTAWVWASSSFQISVPTTSW